MTAKHELDNSGSHLTAFVLLSAFIFLVYSNTFTADWHLDDFHNILQNPQIKIQDLSPQSLKKTFRASYDDGDYAGRNIYRPIAMLSFALNWYWGGEHVIGYHMVNILIHILSAFVLFLVVLSLLDSPNTRGQYRDKRYPIALIASVLWAIHPIQIQAVTYIVQRMASASALFYLFGLYAYVKARTSRTWYGVSTGIALCVLFFLLGLGCKENAVMLPAALLVVELIFYQDINKLKHRKKEVLLVCGTAGVILVCCASFFLDHDFSGLLKGYEQRPYGMAERLMTQFRVLMFYLYQLVHPVPDNFSIAHDFALSRSLVSPWTTLPAVLAILIILGTGIAGFRKKPLMAFAIGFFFLNHVIESTVIPLEMVFEHRNYLPTMFFFLPVASGLVSVLALCRAKGRKAGYLLMSCAVTLLLVAMGIGTYTRNLTWRTEADLWGDAVQKAPGRARPYQLLGYQYFNRDTPQYEKAAALYRKSIGLMSDRRVSALRNAYDKLSLIYAAQGKHEKAVAYGLKAVTAGPGHRKTRLKYALKLVDADRLESALVQLNILLEKQWEYIEVYNTKSRVLMKLGRVDTAADTVLQAMKMDPFNIRAQNYMGVYRFRTHHHAEAEYYFRQVMKKAGPSGRIHYYLILMENSIKAGWEAKKTEYLSALLSEFSPAAIRGTLNTLSLDRYPEIPLSLDKLANEIAGGILSAAGGGDSIHGVGHGEKG